MLTAEQEKEIQEAESEVDMTQIYWMLSLTPLERLKVAQHCAELAWEQNAAPYTLQLSQDADYDPDGLNLYIFRRVRAERQNDTGIDRTER